MAEYTEDEETQDVPDQLSPQQLQILREREEKYKAMGLPIPVLSMSQKEQMANSMPKIATGNPDKMAKLQAIMNGGKKNLFQDIIKQAEPAGKFTPLPVAKPKGQKNNQQKPTTNIALNEIKVSRNPEADMFERDLYGDVSTSSRTSYVQPASGRVDRRGSLEDGYDANTDSGLEFANKIKSKLLEQAPGKSQKTQQNNAVVNSEELDTRIYNIASQVAKSISTEMIKKVLNEYASNSVNSKNVINEGKNEKKAKFLKEDVVEIDGKFFKLTPVTVKKKIQ